MRGNLQKVVVHPGRDAAEGEWQSKCLDTFPEQPQLKTRSYFSLCEHCYLREILWY